MLFVFPGRITLGKLGMWMVTKGTDWQRKYAGWNKAFRLKVYDFGDSQCLAYFHVSCMITPEYQISFHNPNAQPHKQTEYVKELFAIPGVIKVLLSPYKIEIGWGGAFTGEEIIPQVETVLLRHLPIE